MQTLVTAIGVLIASAVAMATISPDAKLWAAEVIERVARFLVIELRARAKAQSAARTTWETVYREEVGHKESVPTVSSSHIAAPAE